MSSRRRGRAAFVGRLGVSCGCSRDAVVSTRQFQKRRRQITAAPRCCCDLLSVESCTKCCHRADAPVRGRRINQLLMQSSCSQPLKRHRSDLASAGRQVRLPSKQQMTSAFWLTRAAIDWQPSHRSEGSLPYACGKEQAKRAADATPRPRRQHQNTLWMKHNDKINPPPRRMIQQSPGPPP